MTNQDGKYFQLSLQNFPEKYTTFEIVDELNQQFYKQFIQLKLVWMEFKEAKNGSNHPQNDLDPKPDFIQRQENRLKKLHWWDSRLFIFSNSFGDQQNDDLHLIQFFRPQLQNYSPIYLARFYDYRVFIEALLQVPNKALISSPVPLENIPNTYDLVQEEIYKKKSCQIRLFGTQAQLDKAKQIADDGLLMIGSQDVKFTKAELVNTNIIPEDLRTSQIIFETQAINVDAGIFKQKLNQYCKYWSLEQVKLVYQNQIEITSVKISIFKLLSYFKVNVIFDICYQYTRRMSFKIEFNIKSSKNQPSSTDPNLCFSDAPIVIEKDSNKKLLNFYFKFAEQPKCYFCESLSNKFYYEPIVRTWNRCQNFLVSKCDLVYSQLIQNSNVIRIQISNDQCKSFDFLNFSKNIEINSLLRFYNPKPSISNHSKYLNQEKFDLCEESLLSLLQNRRIPQIPKRLLWMIVSCLLSTVPIVRDIEGQYNQLLDLILQCSQQYGLVYLALKKARNQFLQERKSQSRFQFSFQELLRFIDRYVKSSQKYGNLVPKEIKKALLTPSGVYPNYFYEENFALQNAIIQENDLSSSKSKIKDRSQLKVALLLLEIKDDDGCILEYNHSYEQNIQNMQTQILHCAYYRKILQDGVTVLGDKFLFVGYSRKMIKNHQCVLISEHYLLQLSKTIFGGALVNRFDLKKIIPLNEIMQILSELLAPVEDFITINEICEKLESNEDIFFSNNIFMVDEFSQNHRSDYQKQLLQPQGIITRKILEQIQQIIFEEDIYFTVLIFRKGEYQGVLQLDPNDQRSMIIVNPDMRQPNSPYNHMLADNNVPIQIQLNQLETIQILSYGLYKPCVLQIYQIVNLALLGSTKLGKQIWKDISFYLRQLMETYTQNNEKQKDSLNNFFSTDRRYLNKSLKSFKNFNDSKTFDNFQNLRIPIKHGAKLIAVYDKALKPNEVYIQISEKNNFHEAFEINESQVLIFKHYALHYESIQTFQTVSDKQLEQELRKRYLQQIDYYSQRNVIVFSSEMNYKLFPIREGDLKQEFIVIWDIRFIFQIKKQQPDHEYYFNYLNFDEIQQEDDNQQILQAFQVTKNFEESIQKSLPQQTQFNGKELVWLEVCRNFIVDAFTLNIGSFNYKSLRYIYTKIAITILYETLQANQQDIHAIQSKNISIDNLHTVLSSLNIANMRQLWFYSTQGRIHTVKLLLIKFDLV